MTGLKTRLYDLKDQGGSKTRLYEPPLPFDP